MFTYSISMVLQESVAGMGDTDRVIQFAEECLMRGQEERPELVWLKERYDRFRKKYELLGKQEADRLIFEKMYSNVPQKSSDTLKIRYWRTGHHVPSNREQCLAFGKALDMNPEELDYLLRRYYDRNDMVFDEVSEERPEYRERRKLMDALLSEYFQKVHPERLQRMKIPYDAMESNVRHLYYTDALKYVDVTWQKDLQPVERHITSINYGSELNRNFRLLGEIPRKTMLRHLLILGIPFLNRKILDERLVRLGYLPLQENHTLVSGEPLDLLLIRLLELYEECCWGMEPDQCSRWFQAACRTLDKYFWEKGNYNLRFMYFKALKE